MQPPWHCTTLMHPLFQRFTCNPMQAPFQRGFACNPWACTESHATFFSDGVQPTYKPLFRWVCMQPSLRGFAGNVLGGTQPHASPFQRGWRVTPMQPLSQGVVWKPLLGGGMQPHELQTIPMQPLSEGFICNLHAIPVSKGFACNSLRLQTTSM